MWAHESKESIEDTYDREMPYNFDKQGTTFWITEYDFNKEPNDNIVVEWDAHYSRNTMAIKLREADSIDLAGKRREYEQAKLCQSPTSPIEDKTDQTKDDASQDPTC